MKHSNLNKNSTFSYTDFLKYMKKYKKENGKTPNPYKYKRVFNKETKK